MKHSRLAGERWKGRKVEREREWDEVGERVGEEESGRGGRGQIDR